MGTPFLGKKNGGRPRSAVRSALSAGEKESLRVAVFFVLERRSLSSEALRHYCCGNACHESEMATAQTNFDHSCPAVQRVRGGPPIRAFEAARPGNYPLWWRAGLPASVATIRQLARIFE